MNKVILILLIIFIMSGCTNESIKNKDANDINSKDKENLTYIKSSGNVYTPTSENVFVISNENVVTLFKKDKDIEVVKESGPFIIKINKIQAIRLKIKEHLKDSFDNKEVVTMVILEIEVENNSVEINTIYPNQGTITVNTKEQNDISSSFSDNLDGEYIGGIMKKGKVIFLIDSDVEDITELKYIISAPIDSNLNKLGEDISFELSF